MIVQTRPTLNLHGQEVEPLQPRSDPEPTQGAVASAADGNGRSRKATLIVHSGDLDRAYAAFIIANGAAAFGLQTTVFFTFWGLNLLRKGGLDKAPLSKMHLLGLGDAIIKGRMAKANVTPLSRLLADSQELGVKLLACDLTLEVMGVSADDLIPEVGGICSVGGYLAEAQDSQITLFI